MLVCASVLVGARVLATSDDTVAVLAARESLVAGQRLDAAALTEVRLRFTSTDDADRYLAADEQLAAGTVLLRPIEPGELVPRSALGADDGLVELPLAVDPGRVPASVRVGSVVDVWVAPDGQGTGGSTERLLVDVPVLAVSRAGGLGAGGMRQVVVGVPEAEEEALGDVVKRLQGSLLVVRRQG